MQHDHEIALRVQREIKPFITGPAAVRNLSIISGLSEPTIRKIASTGIINSARTAVAIERATGGRVSAEWSQQPDAKGSAYYSREPAHSLLLNAAERGISITELLAGLGITNSELWIYMNTESHLHHDVKRRVRAALKAGGVLKDSDEEQKEA